MCHGFCSYVGDDLNHGKTQKVKNDVLAPAEHEFDPTIGNTNIENKNQRNCFSH